MGPSNQVGGKRKKAKYYFTGILVHFRPPFSNVDKRGLITYKTSSEEKEAFQDSNDAELGRLGEELSKNWIELGEDDETFKLHVNIHQYSI